MHKLKELTLIGGIAFWLTTFVISLTPIAADYRAAFSINWASMILVESVIAGMIIAGIISYALIRYFDKIPTKKPVLKSLLLSFTVFSFATIMIQAGSGLLVDDSLYYGIIGVIINIPRFLLLGLGIGYQYTRLNKPEGLVTK
ncbi:MAG: hypothetical protein GF411_12470 [Candidatus Lokiarchaeota archaeon]|nr:hypothetical protein [Candidatus Lokiarchaeota archaeon]